MKKLKLNAENALSKEEMKKVNGGLYGCQVYFTGAAGCPTQPFIGLCPNDWSNGQCQLYFFEWLALDPCVSKVEC